MHLVWDGLPFWLELKVSKGNGVKLSPHQVAWNTAYWVRGGANFILVKRSVERDILLFDGGLSASVLGSGISGTPHARFGDPSALFAGLRPRLESIYTEALRPLAPQALRPSAPKTAPEERRARGTRVRSDEGKNNSVL